MPPVYPPKWDALTSVLQEIRATHAQHLQAQLDAGVANADLGLNFCFKLHFQIFNLILLADRGHVLVLVNSETCAKQILHVIQEGPKTVWRSIISGLS